MKLTPGRLSAALLLPVLLVGPMFAVAMVSKMWPQRPPESLFVPIEALGVGLPALLLAGPGNVRQRLLSSGWQAFRPTMLAGAVLGMLGLAILMTYGQMAWGSLTGLSMPEGLVALMTIEGPGPKLAWLSIGAVILPGLCEEMAFRGVIQRGLFGVHEASGSVPWFRLLVVAVLFADFHRDFYGLPSYLILGGWLGLVAWRTGSLWPGAMAHMANNALALLQANLLEDPWWIANASFLVPLGLLALAAGVWWVFRPARKATAP